MLVAVTATSTTKTTAKTKYNLEVDEDNTYVVMTIVHNSNRNGDGFKEANCRRFHDTFVKHARWFRSHKNKLAEGDPHYGIIKASSYNDTMRRVELIALLNKTKSAADRNGGLVADKEMQKLANNESIPVSMACGLPGTLVKMRHGFKKIEDVETGDEVLTKYGRHRRVYHTMTRVKRQVATVRTECYGRQTLEFTPDHKFWVARWKDVPSATNRNAMRSKDRTGFSKNFRRKYRDQLHAHALYVPCGELKPGDLLLMPIDRGDGSSTISVKESRLLGYYVAEGSLVTGGKHPCGVCLTCNKVDDVVSEISDLVEPGVNLAFDYHSNSDEAYNLRVYSRRLAEVCESEIGRGIRQKVIPRRIYDATAEIKLEFISAWFNGDGWQDVKGLHWSTCSRGLSIELQMLLASVGIPSSVYRSDHTSDLPNETPRTGDGIEYTVNVSNRYSRTFAGRSKAKVVDMKAEKTTVFITGNYLAVPVAGVDIAEGEFVVHDLSVEDDESFTAYGLAVSNCRVSHDVCSFCGHKAKTRDDYCKEASCGAGGCYNNLTRLVKIGSDVHHLHVDNPSPTWFDISMVYRPADRIAYAAGADWLQKAASDENVVGGARLASLLGISAPAAVLALDGSPPDVVAEQLKLASGLNRLPPSNMDVVKLAFAQRTPGDWSFLGEPGTLTASAGLAALADAGVIMPISEFAAWTKRASLAASAAVRLPGVYGRMMADGTLPAKVAAAEFSPAGRPSTMQKRAAYRSVESFGVRAPAVATRSASVAASGVRPVVKTGFDKVASADPSAERLARDYAVYKLAALHAMAANDNDFLLTARLAMSQNQV